MEGNTAVYDLKKEENQNKFDFQFKWGEKKIPSMSASFEYFQRKLIFLLPDLVAKPPLLSANRYLTGYGGERGGFRVYLFLLVSV